MGSSPGFGAADYDDFEAAFRELGARVGIFDANQALVAISARRPTLDAGDVARVLHDLTDLGYLWEVGRHGLEGAKLWAYAGGAKAND
jgi:hypothetical protein